MNIKISSLKKLMLSLVAMAAVLGGVSAQSADTANFDIPPGELSTALKTLAKQTGLELIFQPGDLKGIRTQGVKGNLSPQDAVAKLIDGTKLTIKTDPAGAILITPMRTNAQITSLTLGATNLAQADQAMQKVEKTESSVEDSKKRSETDSDQNSNESSDDAASKGIADVVVTGTLIRDQAPVGAPLISLSREDLERTGYTTLQDALSTVPQFGPGTTPGNRTADSRNAGFATALDLRGLGAGTTLVLVNGRRQPVSGELGSIVDISTIPLSAVERVDILLDGASALYGSDAIGGVVNIILKKDYRGAETTVRYGTYGSAADEFRFSQTFGTTWPGGNVFLGVERYERSELSARERGFSANADQRARGGSDFRTDYASPGFIYDPDTFNTYVIPTGQDGTHLTPGSLTPGVAFANQNELAFLLPEETSTSIFGNISQDLTAKISVNAALKVTERPVSFRYRSNQQFLIVPSSNAFYVDPELGGSDFIYLQTDLGRYLPSNGNGSTRSYRASVGADAELPNSWQLRANAGYGSEDVRLASTTYDPIALDTALADSDPTTAFNPFGDTFTQNLTTLTSILSIYDTQMDSSNITADVIADGPLWHITGGTVRLAVGASYNKDRLNTGSDKDHRTPQLEREVGAGFAELSVPLVGPDQGMPLAHRVDLSIAGRYDSYSDLGGTFNPKLGLRWELNDRLALRSTWSTSFRGAPLTTYDSVVYNIAQIYPGQLADPTSTTGFSSVYSIEGVNPDLKPETSETKTFGIDLKLPDRAGRLSVTYTDIKYEDRVSSPPIDLLFNEDAWRSIITRNPTAAQVTELCASRTFYGVNCEAQSPDLFVDFRPSNFAYTRAQNVDVQFDRTFSFSDGNLTAAFNGTYNIRNEFRLADGDPLVGILGTVGGPPDYRFRFTGLWEARSWSVNTGLNYAPSYADASSIPARAIDDYVTVDTTARFDLPAFLSIDGLSLSITALNIFDEEPPFVNRQFGYDFANANPYGRQLSIDIRKQW